MDDFIFRCTKKSLLVFSNSKIKFTWHICYTSNSASSQFTVQSMITLKIRRPTLRNLVPVPAVLPWSWSPSPRCYHELCPHYRGVTAVTTGKPWSPSPCSSLLWINSLTFPVFRSSGCPVTTMACCRHDVYFNRVHTNDEDEPHDSQFMHVVVGEKSFPAAKSATPPARQIYSSSKVTQTHIASITNFGRKWD